MLVCRGSGAASSTAAALATDSATRRQATPTRAGASVLSPQLSNMAAHHFATLTRSTTTLEVVAIAPGISFTTAGSVWGRSPSQYSSSCTRAGRRQAAQSSVRRTQRLVSSCTSSAGATPFSASATLDHANTQIPRSSEEQDDVIELGLDLDVISFSNLCVDVMVEVRYACQWLSSYLLGCFFLRWSSWLFVWTRPCQWLKS